MIDSLVVRPVLRVTTWVKRHWVATAIILVLLFVAPPLLTSLAWVSRKLFAGVRTVTAAVRFAGDIKAKVDAIVDDVEQKVADGLKALARVPARVYWVAFGVGLLSPLLGATVAAWQFMDQFKTGRDVDNLKRIREGKENEAEMQPPTVPPPIIEAPTNINLPLPDFSTSSFGA